jgi:hypothetical protein
MEIGPETVVSRNGDAVAERLFEETVVLDPQTDRYVRLNRTGTSMWDALERPASVADLAARLVAEFEIDSERAHADVVAFLRQLAERDLIELS